MAVDKPLQAISDIILLAYVSDIKRINNVSEYRILRDMGIYTMFFQNIRGNTRRPGSITSLSLFVKLISYSGVAFNSDNYRHLLPVVVVPVFERKNVRKSVRKKKV